MHCDSVPMPCSPKLPVQVNPRIALVLLWVQVVKARIPQGTAYHEAPVVVLHSLNDFVGSFRHAMFDLMLPVFNLMQLFRMYTSDFLLLEATHQVCHPHSPQSSKRSRTCKFCPKIDNTQLNPIQTAAVRQSCLPALGTANISVSYSAVCNHLIEASHAW